jgi:CRP-like cAMP-binding protein
MDIVSPTELLRHLESEAATGAFARAFRTHVPPARRKDTLARLIGSGAGALRVVERGRDVFADAEIVPGAALFLVLGGLVEEWKGQFRLSVRRPGDLLGELPALTDGTPRQPNAAIARDTARLLTISRDALRAALDAEPGLVRALLGAVAHHARELADDEGQTLEALDAFFPRGFGALTPGPYDCRDVTLHLFPFVLPDAADHPMQLSRPAGVRYASRLFMVALVKMRDTRHPAFDKAFDYDEVTVFVPALVDGQKAPYLHVPFIYADNVMAIILGREISGFPKLQVSTFIEPENPDAPHDEEPRDARWRLLALRDGRRALEMRCAVEPVAQARGARDALAGLRATWRALATDTALSLDDARTLWEQGVNALLATPTSVLNLPRRLGLDTVYTSAWKRLFRPDARYTAKGGARMPARESDFHVDALCETRFQVGTFQSVAALRLDPEPFLGEGMPFAGCTPLSTLGLRVHLSMKMVGGPVLIDYLDDHRWAQDPARLWGPWTRLGGGGA